MNKIIVTLLASVVFVTGVFGQDSQRQRPQRAQLTESQQAIGKMMLEDKGIQKIREKAFKDMIAYLIKKGHSKEDAIAVVKHGAKAAERARSSTGRGGNWGNRQIGPQRRGEGPRRTQGGQRPGGDRPPRQRPQN